MAPLPTNIYHLLEQHVANLTENDTLYHDLWPTMTSGCIRYAIVMNCFLIGFLCTVGTAGNLVSFAVFSKDRVKTSTSFLLQALAVVDSCFLIVVFPTYTVSALLSHYSSSIEEDDVKIYLIPIAYVLQTATIWLVVLVGWNRYIAVCQPFKAAKLCTVARAKKQLAIVLSLAIIYSFPKFIEIPTDLVENNVSALFRNFFYVDIQFLRWYTIFMLINNFYADIQFLCWYIIFTLIYNVYVDKQFLCWYTIFMLINNFYVQIKVDLKEGKYSIILCLPLKTQVHTHIALSNSLSDNNNNCTYQ